MKVYRSWLLIAVLFLLCLPVKAEDIMKEQAESWGADKLEYAMPDEAKELMQEYDLYNAPDFWEAMMEMIKTAFDQNERNLRLSMTVMARVMVIIILCRLADFACEDKTKNIVLLTGVLALTTCCLSDVRTLIGLGKETIDSVSDYASLLLPVMASAAVASGSLTGAGATYMITTVFSNLLIRFCKSILIPAVYAYLALAITDAVVQSNRLKKLRELVGWGIEKGLKAVTYSFVGFLSVSGLLTSSADTAVLKAAKATISGAVPVVGGIISGAADTMLSGAVFLKNTIGTFGMLAVFAAFIVPFINMGISYLLFKITAAIGGVLESKLTAVLEAIGSVLGYLLAMVASCALISILACCCFIRTVHP